jgi:hypothetical protein
MSRPGFGGGNDWKWKALSSWALLRGVCLSIADAVADTVESSIVDGSTHTHTE